jgi:hypothetical protein
MSNELFVRNTRRKVIPLTSQAKGVSNPLSWQLPKTGFLAGIFLRITATVAGTLSAPNALGAASIVRRVKLTANAGPQLIDISGPGYAYLLRDMLEDYVDVVPQNTGRSAVTATTFNLDMWLPVAVNARDPIGLIAMQNEETQLTLSVEFETDAIVATGATVTATVSPFVEIFTVPVDPKAWPDLSVLQQIVEDSRAVSAAGDYQYSWPRGNTYLQVIHGAGIAATAADNWTTARLTLNKSEDIWGLLTPAMVTMEFNRFHGRARILGVIPFDLVGSSGLGNFGSVRDVLYSQLITDLDSVINFAAAGTLYTIRRQLVNLK